MRKAFIQAMLSFAIVLISSLFEAFQSDRIFESKWLSHPFSCIKKIMVSKTGHVMWYLPVETKYYSIT